MPSQLPRAVYERCDDRRRDLRGHEERNRAAEEQNEGAAHVPAAPQTHEELMEAERMQAHLDTADYVSQQRINDERESGDGSGESKRN